MRVCICGDRNYTCIENIEKEILLLKEKYNDNLLIITGKCQGVDNLAERVSIKHNIKHIEYPADWKKYGKAAGPIRNKQMIQEGKPELVIAFHNNIKHSKGTKNMVNQCLAENIEVILIEEK